MAVILTINKNDSKETIQEKIKEWDDRYGKKKGFPAHKFTGKIKFDEDAVTYQRRIRNEWE